MMTKRLPQLTPQRPYKYQELRRKFKAGADSSAARGEEEYRQLLSSRENTSIVNTSRSATNLANATRLNNNLGRSNTNIANNARSNTNLVTARSNTNLGVSKENLARSNTNLAASRESLAIPEEEAEIKTDSKPPKADSKTPQADSKTPKADSKRPKSDSKPQKPTQEKEQYGKLREDIKARQTSLDHMNKRTENGQPVYSFTLSKADRSKSEPVLFPPLSDKQKALKAAQQAANKPNDPENAQLKTQDKDKSKDNKENKPINSVKFPIVSRYDLYKHLGIQQPRRKRTRRESEVSEIRNYARQRQASMHQSTPRIVPATENSGRSRNASVVHGTQDEMVPNKKLEQYKQWHEQQASKRRSRDYDTKEATRLATIYKGDDAARQRANPERLPTRHRRTDTTLPKIGAKDRISNQGNNASRAAVENQQDGPNTDRARRTPSQQPSNAHSSQRGETPPAPIPKELLDRKYSARTWKTWRNHHDSYAYDNVDEYIEDNELMDDEKMWWIKQWIGAVAKAATEPSSDSDDDADDVGTIATSSNDNKSTAESGSHR